jgi:lysyl-tRNA synthetase class II
MIQSINERFEAQMALADRGDDEAMFIDQDFLRWNTECRQHQV